MDVLLELLSSKSSASPLNIAKALTPEVLASASDQQKHKLKVRISSLLRASGTAGTGRERALGAVLARLAIVDWSVIQSHGANWSLALIHMLGLPDRSGWAPALRTLVVLLIKVHRKPDLAREVAGTKVGDTAKKLLGLIGKAPLAVVCQAITALAPRYPAQLRPHLDKMRAALIPLLPLNNSEVSRALAALVYGEKKMSEAWTARFNDELQALRSEDAAPHFVVGSELLRVAGASRARIPALDIVGVLNTSLQSMNIIRARACLEFITTTFYLLEPLYVHQFEPLLYQMVDCANLDRECALLAAQVTTLLYQAVGWVSAEHKQGTIKLVRRVLSWYKKTPLIGTAGLADFVKDRSLFEVGCSSSETENVSQFLAAVIVALPALPQSLRLEIDWFLLEAGGESLRLAVLYPGKFSILPLAVSNYGITGYEALVHPRLPPILPLQPNGNEQAEAADNYHEEAVASETAGPELEQEVSNSAVNFAENNITDDVEMEVDIEEREVLPIIPPLPTITAHEPMPTNTVTITENFEKEEERSLEPAEKRFKADNVGAESISGDGTGAIEDNENDEDDFVVPVLTMDSD